MSQYEHQRPRSRTSEPTADEQQLAPGKRTRVTTEASPLQAASPTARTHAAPAPARSTSPWQGREAIAYPPGSTAESFRDVIDAMWQADEEAEELKDELLYIGMGKGAKAELQALAKQTNVVGVINAKVSDQVIFDGAKYALGDSEQCAQYLQDLGVPFASMETLLPLFARVGDNSRDELGQLVRIFHEAELGERALDRVVVSGHSDGFVCWGESCRIDFDDLIQVCGVFWGASSQVRDLMLAGCNTGYEGTMKVYNECFPNLQSIWGYTGSAPGAHSGAQKHMKIWEAATRGDETPDMQDARGDVRKTRKGGAVSTWTEREGYVETNPITLQQAEEHVRSRWYVFEEADAGTLIVGEHGNPALDALYLDLEALIHHRDTPVERQEELVPQLRKMLRLRHLNNVVRNYVSDKQGVLDAGYAAAGVSQPNWKKLSRVETLAAIEEFAQHLPEGSDGKDPITIAYLALDQGLKYLSDTEIPEAMIDPPSKKKQQGAAQ